MRYQHQNGSIRDNYKHSFRRPDFDAFAQFIAESGGSVPLREISEGTAPERRIALRHDVDHNIDHALRFARWEALRGIRASYFVLPAAWYAAEDGFGDKLHELHDLGHEVGIHNNTVALTWEKGDNVDGTALPGGWCAKAAALLREQLAFLRGFGLDIVGCAGHGSPLYYTDGVDNLDIWTVGYRPADFGLEYEAYHLHRDGFYISDNHGQWTEPLHVEPGLRTHVLTHPCHWDPAEVGQ